MAAEADPYSCLVSPGDLWSCPDDLWSLLAAGMLTVGWLRLE